MFVSSRWHGLLQRSSLKDVIHNSSLARLAHRQKSTLLTQKYGVDIVNDPLLNKGTAFPLAERDRLGIRGLLPTRELTLELQVKRLMEPLNKLTDPLDKWQFVSAVQDRNEHLFYKILIEHIEELAPIVYTPTVGQASLSWSHVYRRQRGMYFSLNDRHQMRAMVYNWPQSDVDVIVVTDGSRILGLGDLGACGMAIPIGKLALYVAAGGIHPSKTLPVLLDVGTDNQSLLKDPLYLGLQTPRVRGDRYFEMVDEFISAATTRWPNVLIQFEDFSNESARALLEKYRNKHLCFNDDIQGTGAMAVAGILGALRSVDLRQRHFPLPALLSPQPTRLTDQRIVCVGAGSAALGVSDALFYAMKKEAILQRTASQGSALSTQEEQAIEQQLRKNFYLVDQYGLLTKARAFPALSAHQTPFARETDDALPEGLSLQEVVDRVQPTLLMGLCAVPGIFRESVVKSMASAVPYPIIFPLSNPTDLAECTAQQAFEWTQGRAIFASGSPFGVVHLPSHTCYPNQGNNMYVYPGVGFAATVCRAKRVTNDMFYTAAHTLAQCVSDEDLLKGIIYPGVKRIREVSRRIAVQVIQCAYEEGVAQYPLKNDESIESLVDRHIWYPSYQPLVYSHERSHRL